MTTAIGLGINVPVSHWDDIEKKIKSTYKGYDSITRVNNYIQKKKVEAFSLITKLEDGGKLKTMSVVEIKNLIINKPENNSFIKYTGYQIEELKSAGRYGSARAYSSMKQVIEKFIGKKDLTFEQINSTFLSKLETDFLSRGNALNGLAAILRSFRACYNKGVTEGKIEKGLSPFDTYKIRKTPTVKRAISKEAISNILSLELEEADPLFHSRNYFMFSYLTFGMNFADMAELSVGNIVDGRIHYIRQKTKQPFDIKITPALKPILDFYTKDKKSNDLLFPIIKRTSPENQYKDILWARKRYNKKLKEIAIACKIEENLTSYVSRHSAATSALFLNIPLPAISRMLGHKSISTTQTYLKTLPDNIIDQYQEMLEKQLG